MLIVEDIIDSGLTLSWLLENFASRGAASVEVFALLRKPEAAKVHVECRYVGFDIPNEFVVGYGLDYAERVPQPARCRRARSARLRLRVCPARPCTPWANAQTRP